MILEQKLLEIERIKQRIEVLSAERPSQKEFFDFFGQIIIELERIKPQLTLELINLNHELAVKKLEAGLPLLDRERIKIDLCSATALFDKLCQLVEQRNEPSAGEIQKIRQAIKVKDLDLAEILTKTLVKNEEYLASLLAKSKVNREILLFLIKSTLKPILELYSQQVKELVQQKAWWKGYCPICGSQPLIGVLRKEEGDLFLYCSCCGFEWRYKRMVCPFCGHEENEKHKYFYLEKAGLAYRVDICDMCKKYLKIIDTRKITYDLVLPIEDLGSLYLDLIAQREGYIKGGENMFYF